MIATKKRGFSIVEILVACAILLTLVGTAAGAFSLYLKLSQNNSDKTQAALLTEESAEALQFLRDQSWKNNIKPLMNGTTYYLYWNGTRYATSTSPIASGSFLVSFQTLAINRDVNGNILDSGGIIDDRTRKITLNIAPTSSTTNIILSTQMLLHDLFQN